MKSFVPLIDERAKDNSDQGRNIISDYSQSPTYIACKGFKRRVKHMCMFKKNNEMNSFTRKTIDLIKCPKYIDKGQ